MLIEPGGDATETPVPEAGRNAESGAVVAPVELGPLDVAFIADGGALCKGKEDPAPPLHADAKTAQPELKATVLSVAWKGLSVIFDFHIREKGMGTPAVRDGRHGNTKQTVALRASRSRSSEP